MWERFSYYGMRAFLILYMTAPAAAGGLGFADASAASIYGTYTGSAWGASILGGLVADRVLGQYRSALLGGVIIAAGHFTLAFKALPFFYTGLALIVLGTGLLKPNVSTLVGSLYAPGDTRRDAGFSIFYMGINLGAFIGPLVAGYLAQRVDWHMGFACAGIGMAFGVIQYMLGKKRLDAAIDRLARQPKDVRTQTASAGARARVDVRRLHASGVETDGRDRHFLPRRGSLLGRLRAGRIDAQSVRRSLHQARRVGLLVPLVVVPVGAADLRDRSSRRCSPGSGRGSDRASRRSRRSSRSGWSS